MRQLLNTMNELRASEIINILKTDVCQARHLVNVMRVQSISVLPCAISHFEVAREIGLISFQSALWDCFEGRIFNSPTMHFDSHLKPISRETSKWLISTLSLKE